MINILCCLYLRLQWDDVYCKYMTYEPGYCYMVCNRVLENGVVNHCCDE